MQHAVLNDVPHLREVEQNIREEKLIQRVAQDHDDVLGRI